MKKIVSVLLTVAMIATMSFFFTACEEELPTPEEVIEKLVEAQSKIQSYEMEANMEMGITMDIPDEGMTFGALMNIDVDAVVTGIFDGTNGEMMMGGDIDLASQEEFTMKMKMEMYLMDNWMYMKMDVPFTDSTWMKTEFPDDEYFDRLQNMDFNESQIELLTTGDIMVTGIEKIDGVDCYVLEISPDMRKGMDLLMRQLELSGETMPEMPLDEFDEMIDKLENCIKVLTVKYWIAKDSYYVIRGNITCNLEISPEALDIPDEEGLVTANITADMRMFNYDEPVSIVLPPEAEDAVEQPSPFNESQPFLLD